MIKHCKRAASGTSYALVAGLIAVVSIAVIDKIGVNVDALLGSASGSMKQAVDAGAPQPAVLALDAGGVDLQALSISASAPGTELLDFSFAIENQGVETSGPLAMALSGAAAYTVQADGCSGNSLQPGASCQMDLRATISANGLYTASLLASANNADDLSIPLALTASGLGDAELAFSANPALTSFAITGAGQSPTACETVSLQNVGDQPTSGDIAASLSAGASNFDLSGCPSDCGPSLATGQSCNLGVRYAPSSAGSHSGTITATASIGGSASIALGGSATGVSAGVATRINGSGGLSFSVTAPANDPSACQNVEISNTGDLSIASMSRSITNNRFEFCTSPSNDCTGVLAPGASCIIAVRFNPDNDATYPGELRVSANGVLAVTVPLTGTSSGIGPADLNRQSPNGTLSFSLSGGATSPTACQNIVIINDGSLTSSNISTTLQNASNHFVTSGCSNTCQGNSLAAGQTCSIGIRYRPQTTGNHSATLQVTASQGGTVSSNISGSASGLDGAVLVRTGGSGTLTFTVTTPSQSPTACKYYTVINNGNLPSVTLNLQAVYSGSAFIFTGCTGTCNSLKLQPGSTCTAGIRYSPSANGSASGTLRVRDPATNAALVTAPISGTASGF